MTDPTPDRAERMRIAAEARVVAALCGAEPDPWLDALTQRWVDGQITIGQMWAQVDALYGLPPRDLDAER